MEEIDMGKGGFPEDDECWSIAESLIEEIELIKGKKTCRLSLCSRPKGNFKRLLMKRVKMARALRAIGQ